MGLRRFQHKGSHFYMYYHVTSKNKRKTGLEIVILSKEFPSLLKITGESDDVRLWCVKMGRSPEVYLEQLCEAVGDEDRNVDMFEVIEGELVWKQYFPDKNVYGKKGKFRIDKVEYQEAVERVVSGAMQDLRTSSCRIHSLTQEAQLTATKLDETLDLLSRNVQMKEKMEREIYSKCAALINTKKLRIHQLRSTHPSSSAAGRSGYLVRTGDEIPTETTSPTKKRRKTKPQSEGGESDGYSTDTDVDEPEEMEEEEEELDTDEEQNIKLRLSPTKTATKETGSGDGASEIKTNEIEMPNSEDLFNASLEDDLYAPSAKPGRQSSNTDTKIGDSNGKMDTKAETRRNIKGNNKTNAKGDKRDSSIMDTKMDAKMNPQSPPQLMRTKGAQGVPSPSNATSEDDYEVDTQMSILNTLF